MSCAMAWGFANSDSEPQRTRHALPRMNREREGIFPYDPVYLVVIDIRGYFVVAWNKENLTKVLNNSKKDQLDELDLLTAVVPTILGPTKLRMHGLRSAHLLGEARGLSTPGTHTALSLAIYGLWSLLDKPSTEDAAKDHQKKYLF